MLKKILFNLLFFLLFTPTFSEEIKGVATVVDGDSIKINKKKIRLFGIDAPEKEQICKKVYLSFFIFNFQKDYKCGEKSASALSKKLKDKKVKCILEKNGEEI